ncbi:TPA: hypothetical protein QDC20_000527 [Burkholderia aenigmatica]|uniref:hypothetical protein n=1 Tax=Burkholderia sp. AU45251 TaxID=3059204 RepID=UPI00264C37B0|nr:hypothetical protein [Burkholderia sp. AU45251]HDR9482385.1 hypothetical protein [Burkholderia aenigmatica]MDN7514976.1 hypothetical protein [Burkholderia sp. AU45251]HDR9514691.1 hypothetical protein [Burkholderia aenigmatica]HDR9590756.1 hypothetical protein [Burkholderia aenigmatica]HDR9599912.1 hypothetical protein [Burkholderia aenigmatica]
MAANGRQDLPPANRFGRPIAVQVDPQVIIEAEQRHEPTAVMIAFTRDASRAVHANSRGTPLGRRADNRAMGAVGANADSCFSIDSLTTHPDDYDPINGTWRINNSVNYVFGVCDGVQFGDVTARRVPARPLD